MQSEAAITVQALRTERLELGIPVPFDLVLDHSTRERTSKGPLMQFGKYHRKNKFFYVNFVRILLKERLISLTIDTLPYII